MIAFKGGRERLLVATDVAARGLDIAGVSHIVNYDIPNTPDLYVHRIGRTGRAGETGRAITMITPKQRRDLEAIERHAGTDIPVWSKNGAAPSKRSVPAEPKPEATSPVAVAEPEPEPENVPEPRAAIRERPKRERREPRRRRHSKPRREDVSTDVVKLIFGAGRAQGIEPADVVSAIVDGSHLDGEDVRNVRVLERFSFVEVPSDRAGEVVSKIRGNEVRGVELRVEVAKR